MGGLVLSANEENKAGIAECSLRKIEGLTAIREAGGRNGN